MQRASLSLLMLQLHMSNEARQCLITGAELKWLLGKWPVLVSAGIELIFLLVAGIVLCFGFSMRRMLITVIFSVVAK